MTVWLTVFTTFGSSFPHDAVETVVLMLNSLWRVYHTFSHLLPTTGAPKLCKIVSHHIGTCLCVYYGYEVMILVIGLVLNGLKGEKIMWFNKCGNFGDRMSG